jgi:hypothetical protein
MFRAVVTGSVLLLVALLALFFRSIYAADLIRYRTGSGRYLELATIPSQLRISHGAHWPLAQPLEWTHGSYQSVSTVGAVGHHLMRWQAALAVDNQFYRVGGPSGVNRVSVSTIAIPFPSLILFAVMPLLILWASRRYCQRISQSRKKAGLCMYCGYDLRATNGRCPECGAATQTAT